jgi:hypothetical protein
MRRRAWTTTHSNGWMKWEDSDAAGSWSSGTYIVVHWGTGSGYPEVFTPTNAAQTLAISISKTMNILHVLLYCSSWLPVIFWIMWSNESNFQEESMPKPKIHQSLLTCSRRSLSTLDVKVLLHIHKQWLWWIPVQLQFAVLTAVHDLLGHGQSIPDLKNVRT